MTIIRDLIQQIHNTRGRIVLVTAGAGTQALHTILSVEGASRTLLEAIIPYHQNAFNDFLGHTPAKYVSDVTARQLAGRALTRARLLEDEAQPVLGLACSAAITSDYPRRGHHHAHIATWQSDKLVKIYLRLEKNKRSREEEEAIVSNIMLNCVASAHNLSAQLPLPLTAHDQITTDIIDFSQAASALLRGESHIFRISEKGFLRSPHHPLPKAILPGSFNPLHEGHLGLARAASQLLGTSVAFECAVINVDKPPLTVAAILDRMAQFAGRHTVIATDAPTFIEKARLFPGATFIVGFDTAHRIVHPRYYEHSYEKMIDALNEIRDLGCRFLVAGRVNKEGFFQHINNLDIPAEMGSLFHAIPTSHFRLDISSTQLRQTGQRGSR